MFKSFLLHLAKDSPYSIEIMNSNDIPEALAVAERVFYKMIGWPSEKVSKAIIESCSPDFRPSHVVKVEGKIVGGYFLAENKIKLRGYKKKRGVEGVCLFLLPEYRNLGIGRELRELPRKLGYDYVWGQALEQLSNLDKWISTGRRLVRIEEEDGQLFYTTIQDFK